MSPGQMLPGQMLLWQFKSVQDSPRNLSLKFGQNRVSNSWDITDIEFVWWVAWGGIVQPGTKLGNCINILDFNDSKDFSDFWLKIVSNFLTSKTQRIFREFKDFKHVYGLKFPQKKALKIVWALTTQKTLNNLNTSMALFQTLKKTKSLEKP